MKLPVRPERSGRHSDRTRVRTPPATGTPRASSAAPSTGTEGVQDEGQGPAAEVAGPRGREGAVGDRGQAAREALPIVFEEFRDVVVHETAGPEVIVAEYALVAAIEAAIS
ncbi:hypothetical protein [Actinomadura madurae]|uniref:hypothetical protein n=1 Tax=Actinomadura madurae TaxID=1993 RepID=UPI0020D20022|nr:hypothetical protein [Actinomadura madurae]MCQ0013422.1 hypothetical protein [Actinomadura madurae]